MILVAEAPGAGGIRFQIPKKYTVSQKNVMTRFRPYGAPQQQNVPPPAEARAIESSFQQTNSNSLRLSNMNQQSEGKT